MSRFTWPAALVLVAVILAGGGVLTARSLRPAAPGAPAPRVTVTASPKVITRWRTRVVHRTRTVTRDVVDPDVVPCTVYKGRLLVFPDSFSTAGSPVQACAVSPVPPYASGVQRAQATDGQTVDFTVSG